MMGIKRSDSIENFYEIETMLGKGAFGEVVKAKHIFSNDYRAIKIIEKNRIKKHRILMQLQMQELNILMQAVSHPFQSVNQVM